MLFFMAFFKRKCICNSHRVMLILDFPSMFADCTSLSMASNRPLELGLNVLLLSFFIWASLPLWQIHPFSFITILTSPSISLSMWMILLLLGMILLRFHIWLQLWDIPLNWKILVLFPIFLGSRLCLQSLVSLNVNLSMPLIFSTNFTWRMLSQPKHPTAPPLASVLIPVLPYLIHLSTKVWLGHSNTWLSLLISHFFGANSWLIPPRVWGRMLR